MVTADWFGNAVKTFKDNEGTRGEKKKLTDIRFYGLVFLRTWIGTKTYWTVFFDSGYAVLLWYWI